MSYNNLPTTNPRQPNVTIEKVSMSHLTECRIDFMKKQSSILSYINISQIQNQRAKMELS